MDLIFNSTQTPGQSFVRKTDMFFFVNKYIRRSLRGSILPITNLGFFPRYPTIKSNRYCAQGLSICLGT